MARGSTGIGRLYLPKPYVLSALALLLVPGTLFAESVIHTALPLGGSNNAQAEITARMVASILDYTRWPAKPGPLRICVVGPARHADRLEDITLLNGTRVERKTLGSTTESGGACDALYMGALSMAAMRQATANARGKAIVTIAENDPECRSEAMFCLLFKQTSLSFQLNVDAVSRSAVRIDPRVLRMAKGY